VPVWTLWRKEKSLAPARIEPQLSSPQTVTTPIEISQPKIKVIEVTDYAKIKHL
jgi:hypothetical protein